MLKITVVVLLFSTILCKYNTTMAHNMVNVCAAAFSTEAEINNWSCKYCNEYKLINVSVNISRPKLSVTPSWIFLGLLATLLRIMLSLSHSGVLFRFRIGLLTSMPLR